jgi:hypothetical protein
MKELMDAPTRMQIVRDGILVWEIVASQRDVSKLWSIYVSNCVSGNIDPGYSVNTHPDFRHYDVRVGQSVLPVWENK